MNIFNKVKAYLSYFSVLIAKFLTAWIKQHEFYRFGIFYKYSSFIISKPPVLANIRSTPKSNKSYFLSSFTETSCEKLFA